MNGSTPVIHTGGSSPAEYTFKDSARTLGPLNQHPDSFTVRMRRDAASGQGGTLLSLATGCRRPVNPRPVDRSCRQVDGVFIVGVRESVNKGPRTGSAKPATRTRHCPSSSCAKTQRKLRKRHPLGYCPQVLAEAPNHVNSQISIHRFPSKPASNVGNALPLPGLDEFIDVEGY